MSFVTSSERSSYRGGGISTIIMIYLNIKYSVAILSYGSSVCDYYQNKKAAIKLTSCQSSKPGRQRAIRSLFVLFLFVCWVVCLLGCLVCMFVCLFHQRYNDVPCFCFCFCFVLFCFCFRVFVVVLF